MVSINRNINSLKVARNLGAATNSLTNSFERLSSGLRINRASDDAAGLAIADSLRTGARLYTAASRNINDGLSALNIISSTLNEQSSILQRLSELAEQAANGTYSSLQRSNLDDEYQALVREFGRTGDTTSFNGISLLLSGRPGAASSISLQTGINGRATSSISISAGNTGTLSGTIYASRLLGSGTFVLEGGDYLFENLAEQFQGQLLSVRITDSIGVEREVFLGVDHTESGYAFQVYAKGSDLGPNGYWYNGDSFEVTSQSNYYNIATVNVPTNANGVPSSSGIYFPLSFESQTISGAVALDISGLQFQRSATAGASQILTGVVAGSTAIDFSSVRSVSQARAAIDLVRARLAELGQLQGVIGASQSRLLSSLRLSDSSRENNLAAESRIRDVDVASESARLVASQIRQQTAAAILGQANNSSALALQFLKF